MPYSCHCTTENKLEVLGNLLYCLSLANYFKSWRQFAVKVSIDGLREYECYLFERLSEGNGQVKHF